MAQKDLGPQLLAQFEIFCVLSFCVNPLRWWSSTLPTRSTTSCRQSRGFLGSGTSLGRKWTEDRKEAGSRRDQKPILSTWAPASPASSRTRSRCPKLSRKGWSRWKLFLTTFRLEVATWWSLRMWSEDGEDRFEIKKKREDKSPILFAHWEHRSVALQ